MSQPLYAGSCLCGAIQYDIHGELGPIVMCHCSMCRKAQGSGHATNSPVTAADFRITTGESSLSIYTAGDGKERLFCRHCGAPIISRRLDKPDTVRLRLGTLDTPIKQRPAAHIFAASKAEWETINDELPQHATFEPSRQT